MKEIKNIGELFKLYMPQFTPENDAAVLEYIQKQEEAERIKRYKESVPERYWEESLDTYKTDTEEQQKMIDIARKYAQAVKCGQFQTLIFLGANGTGKTHLACGIIREIGGQYRLSSAIVEEFRCTKSFNTKETRTNILDSYGRTKLLVIDEIGREIAALEEQYMLYQIINERYNRRKPTVLISNHMKNDFLKYVGIAAADRLTESGQIAEFFGESHRRKIRLKGANNAICPTRV